MSSWIFSVALQIHLNGAGFLETFVQNLYENNTLN